MASILFVCTGNMYRSPIAAETFRGILLRDKNRKGWKVESAGTWTTEGKPAPNDAIEIAGSFGINLNAHQTRMVNKQIMEENDLIIVMEEGHKEALQVEFPTAHNKIYLLTYAVQGVDYDIADPASSRGETRAILQEVTNMVGAGYEKICSLAQ